MIKGHCAEARVTSGMGPGYCYFPDDFCILALFQPMSCELRAQFGSGAHTEGDRRIVCSTGQAERC
jgi:hypothetical protein